MEEVVKEEGEKDDTVSLAQDIFGKCQARQHHGDGEMAQASRRGRKLPPVLHRPIFVTAQETVQISVPLADKCQMPLLSSKAKAFCKDSTLWTQNLKVQTSSGFFSAIFLNRVDLIQTTKDCVSEQSADRLSILEQALPLATRPNNDLSPWLDKMEIEKPNLDRPGIRLDHSERKQEGSKLPITDVNKHQPQWCLSGQAMH